MFAEIEKNRVSIYEPNIRYNEKNELILDGICWVKDDQLDCYNWENEDMLWILDTIPASDNDIPEDRYYCHNVNQNATGWVLHHQVNFNLELAE
ncbi:hypothetical protein G7L40_20580 [Paenibacillus polymyxa]|uniref:Uncharacterized protein n=1 Tax=Paenibacillus polymyxa TaxID=1406 RepID=A0A378XZD6_PAEPO|nr:hypothetical protein [Paenibacillus polymyxa]MBE7896113.1 hypothetical protein [Paenibacillus polymyxa]MBG9765941.1 hypothetical protein [Paenibacillus polymyxa]MCC3256643.1 hypothetical protein [Paenibacillus polymyxa]QPK54866.1 hypothetical protein G7035_20625 [Paenibacillus polymyxa]QPK59956.1 hypothetical protein G7L40_20580 [Paenibacillus polymyxa]